MERFGAVLVAMIFSGAADARPAFAEARQPSASIHGRTTTDRGRAVLPGVTVTVVDVSTGRQVALVISDAEGRYRAIGLTPATYDIRADLQGFAPMSRRAVVLRRNDDVTVELDIALAMSTTIEARVTADDVAISGTSETAIDAGLINVAPVKGDDYQSLLPLAPGVVRGSDGRINVKGGRPSETGQQVNQAYASDPVTGSALAGIPVDAVSSVTVLPNPYAAEYGRFASGIVRLDTRKGGDSWRTTANNFVPAPCLKICDGSSWGIRSYDPRLSVTGPVVAGRVFLAQSLQFHHHQERVTSLPRDAADLGVHGIDAFTRVDARVGAHEFTVTASPFLQRLQFVGLDTFHPQAVAPDVHQRGYGVTLLDTWRPRRATMFETVVSHGRQRQSVESRADGVMTIAPVGADGTFFNRSNRTSATTQVSEAFSTVRSFMGDHAMKVGIDALWSSFAGTSSSGTVEIRRGDGTLAERLTFDGASAQTGQSTDVGAFLQDRWRMTDRVIGEWGVRVDRDGVTGARSVSPRAGFVVSLVPDSRAVIRGGVGRFVGRTPLMAGAFPSLEGYTAQSFERDGEVPVGASARVVYSIAEALRPASARVWNVEYDQKMGESLSFKVNHLERDGWHELVVEPRGDGTERTIDLTSSGHSTYRETEATIRYRRPDVADVTATYVYSRARADLNAFDTSFGTVRDPIIRPGQFGPTTTDVPHRVVLLAAWPVRGWSLSPLLEVRSGFPFSQRDGAQKFVGARNEAGRFPTFVSLDLNILRTVTIRGRHARLGLRSNHLLGNFTPRDIQANVEAAEFGRLYNSIPRRLQFTVEVMP